MTLNKTDSGYVLMWSKKIRLINLLGGKCSHCGKTDIFVLDFHHPSDNKEHNVQGIKSCRFSVMEKEALKCILLCRNCHVELHYDDGGKCRKRSKLKLEMLKYKNIFNCEKCGHRGRNYRSLEFHHRKPEEKDFEIFSEVWSGGVESKIMRELDKCSVICRNCHGIEHTNVSKFNSLKQEILEKVSSYQEHSPIDKSVVIRMHNEGFRNIEIARKLNCVRSSITYLLKNQD